MKSLFDLAMTRWPQDHNSLHVYALPGIPDSDLAPIQNAIRRSNVCSIQPTHFLHATVTRVPAFLDSMTPESLQRLQSALSSSTRNLSPFTVALTGPKTTEHSVGLEGSPSPEWAKLVQGVRGCVAETFVDSQMPPAPYAPHVSLGYGTQEVSSKPLIRELNTLETDRGQSLTVQMRISEVQLLAVHQRAAEGIYTWDLLSTHTFGNSGVRLE